MYFGILYLRSKNCIMTQTLYNYCYKIALLMSLSTRNYYYDNRKYSMDSKLGGIVWNGQWMEGLIR